MNFREALDGLICIAMFNAIAERVAVNGVNSCEVYLGLQKGINAS